MRSNGLTAPTYTPVADVEPQVADALLDELRAEGVAAYTNPVESSTVGGFDRPEYRVGVKDRLFVDSAAAERVKGLLADRDPELVEGNEDLTWAQLVAGFDQPVESERAPWPVDEELGVHDGPVVDERDLRSRYRAHDVPEPPAPHRFGSRPLDSDATDDDVFLSSTISGSNAPASDPEDRFVPPPPPPLPKLPPYKILAWIGLIGGPALLIFCVLTGYILPSWAVVLSVVGFIGGFITLVATMGDGHDDDWDPGNGAVV